MENEIFERIEIFVEKNRWKYKFQLTRETRLEEDLKIYGDDSTEFLIAFAEEFNVNMSKFMADEYFSSEGFDLIGPIIGFFTGRQETAKKILTLGHLEKAVLVGRLDEEVITNH